MAKLKFRCFKFIATKAFLFHLLIAVLVTVILIIVTSLILNNYTNHGEELPTPNLVNLPLQQALDSADSKNIEIIVIDSVYREKLNPGIVIKQDPKPNFSIKEKRKIFITINSFSPPNLKMPYLVNKTFKEAKIIIKSYGLKIGKIFYVPNIAKDRVLKQKIRGKNIKPGTQISKGMRVDLVLGDGLSEDKVEVPNLSSLTLSEAREKLNASQLNLGRVKYDGSIFSAIDTNNAFIYRQLPKYQAETDAGDYVDLWLTLDFNKVE